MRQSWSTNCADQPWDASLGLGSDIPSLACFPFQVLRPSSAFSLRLTVPVQVLPRPSDSWSKLLSKKKTWTCQPAGSCSWHLQTFPMLRSHPYSLNSSRGGKMTLSSPATLWCVFGSLFTRVSAMVHQAMVLSEAGQVIASISAPTA